LPSDSPEMNPDESLNGDLKHRIRSAALARNLKQLEKTVGWPHAYAAQEAWACQKLLQASLYRLRGMNVFVSEVNRN
jgi:hypothetical protein